MAAVNIGKSRSMKKAIGAAIGVSLALAMATATTAPLSAQSVNITPPQSRVTLSVGRGKLITLPSPIEDVFIAENQIADVQVRSPRQLYIFGKKGGQTSFYATNRAGKVAPDRVAYNCRTACRGGDDIVIGFTGKKHPAGQRS